MHSCGEFFLGKCMGTKSTIHVALWRRSYLYSQAKSCANDTTYCSNLHQNCPEIVSVDEIMGNKTKVTIGQRISRSGKWRQKQDFSPLYRNAAFFSMRGNLKTRHHRLKPISFAPLCAVTSHGQREPTGDKVHNVCVTIFLRVFFFYCSKQSNHVLSWITTNLYQQHLQMNELCAVWVMTEESLKRYPACVPVPFTADRKGGIFSFIY